MGKKDPRVDSYIAKARPFAKPVLNHLRQLVHQACPDVEETIKWGMPYFDHRGMLCGMAAFKEHCAFVFWKASLMSDPDKALTRTNRTAMGHLDRITNIKDLPTKPIMVKLIKEAVKLNEDGIRINRAVKPRAKVEVPDYFMAAIRKNKRALAAFEAFPPSHKREYVEWVTEAKRDETRAERLKTTVVWLAEGKSRSWKYAKNRK
ncbi:MAG: YdeI/OmpD-associated family protein [Candidatus Zixiibacteriota bacterium]